MRCDKCKVDMQPLGTIPFATGMLSPLFGRSEGWGKDIMQLDVYVCPQCRKLELFYPEPGREFHKPEQNTDTPKQFLKTCVKCRKSIPIASEECPFCDSKQPSRSER